MTDRMQDARALWTLARPRGAVWVVLLPLFGYGFAHWDGAYKARAVGSAAWLVLSWLALHAGTLWLNAALDDDDEDVLWAAATPVPKMASQAGFAALIASVSLALFAGPVAGLCGALCAVLAVLYSHPKTAWKGHLVLGLGVNIVGYGLLSPIAGWSVTGIVPSARAVVSLGLLAVWIAGAALLAQAFQERADRERGYRTVVAVLGATRTATAARVVFGLGALGILTLTLVGWYPRVILVVMPLWLWVDAAIATRSPTSRWANRAFLRIVAFGLIVLTATLAEHAVYRLSAGPTAGLATASGWPADRVWVRQARLNR